jgi:predicted ester cyclase
MSEGALDREQENKNVLRCLYAEFVDRGNAQVLEEIIAADFVSDAAPAVKGIEAVKAIVLPVREAFPDLHHTIHELVAEGDRVAVRWTMKGTHRGAFSGIPADDPGADRCCNRG